MCLLFVCCLSDLALFFAFIMVTSSSSSSASSNNEDVIINLDLGNPLHMYSNNFITNSVIYVKLIQATALKLAINTRNKNGFIDGSCAKAAYASSAALFNQWERCNSIVLS